MSEQDRRSIGDLLTAATVALTVEPGAGDSAASTEPVMEAVMEALMEALWRGFCVAGAAGELLGICADPDTYPPLWRNAQPVLAAVITALRRAPALPGGLTMEVNPAGGPDDLLDDDTADRIRAQILMLAAALNTAAALAARRATDPDDTQACRRTPDWDIEGVRDDVRDYALDHLGDSVTGVFVLDDTGFIKKGRRSAGVQRPVHGHHREDRELSAWCSWPTPGPDLAGLVCPHHPGDARAGLPRGHPRPRTPA